MSKVKLKKQKNSYRKLNSTAEIAKIIGLHSRSIDKVYFTDKNPKKLPMGEALDIGVFILRHKISKDEVVFLVDFLLSHKEYIRGRL